MIYISHSTPFISILKRIRKLLSHIEDRASGAIKLTRDGKDTFKAIEKGLQNGGGKGKERPRDEEVQVRATGRAIGKALQVAIRLQLEEGWRVRFETGSVGAVDDVVERMRPKKESKKGKEEMSTTEEKVDHGVEEDKDVDMDAPEHNIANIEDDIEEADIEESRVRRVSCFIIYVGLK